jgi:GNAT superfamily N-acetyltransferase
MTAWRIRPAVPDDVASIDALIRELAEYEREPDAVEATPADLRTALFSPSPRVHCHVAEVDTPAGPEVAGMALWFVTYSTWRGRHGIWLEDLYVRPVHRQLGLGKALLAALARICADRGYPRLEWMVLDWNEPAQAFYRRIGAVPHAGWTTWRLSDRGIKELAEISP